ncbi:MAG: rod shape-determining protein MreD [Burkholderiales bacterium]|nr:MAG: rod shape-determining protein MreD [Burkholderiales bacterium]
MIMRAGQQLLLPVKPWFIWASLVVALMINVLLSTLFGRAAWPPDMLALALVFWVIHQPLRVGVGTAFVFGLCMDVHQGALLGQHALAYTALSFFAITISRRLLWYSIPSQALQIFPLLAAAHALQLVVRLLAGHAFPGWDFVLAPVIEALLWPIVTVILLAPQMRAPDPDANRPL